MKPRVWLPVFALVYRIALHSVFGESWKVFLSNTLLTNIAIDNRTGNVYLGGVNSITKLSANLKLLKTVKSGPKKDHPDCWPPKLQESCEHGTRKFTDNINKILILHEQKDELIACGSVYRGFCEMRNLSSLLSLNLDGYFVTGSDNESAVGMIAPSLNGELKFYVGASWLESHHRLVKDVYKLYNFVTRNLGVDSGGVFGFGIFSPNDKVYSGIAKRANIQEGWKMDFRYIFSSGFFSYFVFAIGEKLKAKASAISRVCQKDGAYQSYVQIPLQCNSTKGTNYNLIQSAILSKAGVAFAANLGVNPNEDVLIAVFAKSHSVTSFNPSTESAVCVYSIEDINRMFKTNIELCATRKVKTKGLQWLKRAASDDDNCLSEDVSRHDCQRADEPLKNKAIGGEKALTASPVLEYNKSRLTAVVAMAIENYTAVFIGTASGRLLKISVKNNNKLVAPYEEKNLAVSSEVLKLAFSMDKQSYFVLTGKQVIKLPVQECHKFLTCEACTGNGDPFCGWCALEKRCTVISKCPKSNVELRFVKTPDECVKFAAIKPNKVPHGADEELSLTMENLPTLSASQSYKCFINNKEQVTTISLPVIKCKTPKAADLPPITSDTGDVKVELALKSSETGVKFAVTVITFYQCKKISSCLACTDGNYPCNWCVYKMKCSAGIVDCPAGDILVKSKKIRVGDDPACPQLIPNTSSKLLVPSGVTTTFLVNGTHLPRDKPGYEYKCSVSIGGSTQTGSAQWKDTDHLICKDIKFSYPQNEQNYLAVLHVLWNNVDDNKVEQIGNPKGVSVLLYKCSISRGSCSICWNADQELGCGWCYSQDQCVVQRACASKWTTWPQPCNIKPQITWFWPKAGPTNGGTEVEIIGKDLGKRFEDIENNVLVAGFKCKPDRGKYEVSRRILCITTGTGNVERKSGAVHVTVDGLRGSSQEVFTFQNPIVRDFYPKKGPESGGTLVNITGEYLDTGRLITATLANVPCSVNRTQVTETSLLCRAVEVRRTVNNRIEKRAVVESGQVVLTFDGYRPPPPSGVFEFTPDPTVTDILPSKTFVSGGQTLRVTGNNFESIQNPKIFFKRGDGSNSLVAVEDCQKLSNVEIMCPSPNASALGVKPFSNNGSEVCVAFIMDDVKKLQNCSFYMAVVSDPFFFPFDGSDQLHQLKDKQLILKGRNLNAITKRDVRVTVQNGNCNITSLDKELLLCLVPREDDLQATEDKKYPVTVYVGNLIFDIGKLQYFMIPDAKDMTMNWIIIGVVGFVLLLFIVLVVCYHRRKHKKTKKKVENVAREMEALESKVAKECREAFAELQTDVTDLTSDLITFGMPFLEFRYYALRVLFPNQEDHPVLHEREGYPGHNWEAGLRQFSQLINNKDFLLIFIRTLEAQTTFNMRDRCDVASLLMVSLQGRMEYATDILRHLLCELIKKSVAKRDPKLLLRRTESVAEKMLSDWLAFCMYSFLKLEAGEPLFVLFKAIKRQVEKGPVDAITGEARYSLSEDRLLRQAVEFEKVTVSVEYDETPPENVVLLDCDSISQAKDKILDAIYKNKPYSARLGRDTLQLEWLHAGGRVRPLRDDDKSSKVEGEWRRINTVSHYNISNGDKLRLTAQQNYFYSPVSISESSFHRSMPSLGYTPTSYTPLAQSDATLEEGGKVWHLIKQVDYPTEKEEPSQGKMLSEIYLTRLLSTKGTLQEFVDVMFKTIFSVPNQMSRFPKAIKFLFDLLDDQAKELNLEDDEVLHMWKNNSLPLRFWINIIKNPNFIFDIEKSGIVDSCLSVIAQLFMDSCSVSIDTLGTDSPSNKLLYAREIPNYNERVKRFYRDISESPRPTDEELADYFADMSMQYSTAFNVDNALKDLFVYAKKYQEKLQDAFEECSMSSMASKLELAIAAVED